MLLEFSANAQTPPFQTPRRRRSTARASSCGRRRTRLRRFELLWPDRFPDANLDSSRRGYAPHELFFRRHADSPAQAALMLAGIPAICGSARREHRAGADETTVAQTLKNSAIAPA